MPTARTLRDALEGPIDTKLHLLPRHTEMTRPTAAGTRRFWRRTLRLWPARAMAASDLLTSICAVGARIQARFDQGGDGLDRRAPGRDTEAGEENTLEGYQAMKSAGPSEELTRTILLCLSPTSPLG